MLGAGAAIGLAARAVVKRSRPPRVLGVQVPRVNLKVPRVDPSDLVPRKIDVKKLAKQIDKIAERVENTSEDVRVASAQARRVTKRIS